MVNLELFFIIESLPVVHLGHLGDVMADFALFFEFFHDVGKSVRVYRVRKLRHGYHGLWLPIVELAVKEGQVGASNSCGVRGRSLLFFLTRTMTPKG